MKKQNIILVLNLLLFSINMDLEMCMEMASPQDGYIQKRKHVH
ncbi:hypothetical protein IX324_003044 [Bacteroides pyogenes]|nr:hypothetical protein [Bacteroides pyogenes]